MKQAIVMYPDTVKHVLLVTDLLRANNIPWRLEDTEKEPTPDILPEPTPPPITKRQQRRKKGVDNWCGPHREVKILQKMKNFKPKMPDGLKAMAVVILEDHTGKVFRRDALTAFLQEQMSITRLQSSGIISDLLTTKLIKLEKRAT